MARLEVWLGSQSSSTTFLPILAAARASETPIALLPSSIPADVIEAAIQSTQLNGAWVSIQNLAVRQRQQIDADVGALLETLAPIPDLLTSTGKGSPTT